MNAARNVLALALIALAAVACGDDVATSSIPPNADADVAPDDTDADSPDTPEPTDDTDPQPPDTANADADTTDDAPDPQDTSDDTTDAPLDDADADDTGCDAPPPLASELFVGPVSGRFAPCHDAEHFVIAAPGSELLLEFGPLPEGTAVRVVALGGEVLAETTGGGQPASVSWTVPDHQTEIRLHLDRPEANDAAAWSGLLTCVSGCDRHPTRYPIVLIHGLAGTDRYFGLLEYFYDIDALYTDAGIVHLAPVSQFIGHSELRAPQVAEAVDAFMTEHHLRKVHLLGHSQGGLDMRVLVNLPGWHDRIASMTTVATPHHGIDVDIPEFLTGMDFSNEYLDGAFARTWPDPTDIPRFSWAGRTCSRFEQDCQAQNHQEVVELVLAASYFAIKGLHASDAYGGQNDGLVPVASASWGELLGVLPADHFDEVGQIRDTDNPSFDHRAFYLDEAQRLRQLELDLGL